MNQNPGSECEQLWREFVREHEAGDSSQLALLSGSRTELLGCLRDALGRPHERVLALRLLKIMPEEDRRAMMRELLAFATWQNQVTELAKELIFSVSREWLRDNILTFVEPLLQGTDYEEFWGALEIVDQIDRPKALALARRIAAHTDPDIREAGETFLERLGRRDTE
jgi:hypothetical protein